jgi:hypothetical protein
MFIHSFIELSSLYTEEYVRVAPSFGVQRPNITIHSGAIHVPHRLNSGNYKRTLPFSTYIVQVLFTYLHLALYEVIFLYSSVFCNFTALVQFIVLF